MSTELDTGKDPDHEPDLTRRHLGLGLLAVLGGGLGVVKTAVALTPIACALLDEKEALALVGGPLGEISKGEQEPTSENGHDHSSWCGFFPKGYDSRKADRPAERGLQLQLHAMRNNADARNFYENTVAMVEEMAQASGPSGGAKISPLAGMGEAARMEVDTSEPEPKIVYHVVTVHFFKGSVMGQVTVWRKAAPADEIARAAAKQIIAKLP